MELHQLASHPGWVLAPGASDIYTSTSNPDLTIGPDHEEPTVLALTDGGGDLYVKGSLRQLLNTATMLTNLGVKVHPDWVVELLQRDWYCPTCDRTFIPGPGFRCWRGPGVDPYHVCGQCYVQMVGGA